MAGNKQRGVRLQTKKAMIGRAFVYPWFLGTLLFTLVPLAMSLVYTFHSMSISGGGGYELRFVGLANYVKAFSQDTFFAEYYLLGLRELAFRIPLILLYSLFAAVLLNQKFKGRGFVRSVFFLPVVVTSGALVFALNMGVSQDSAASASSVMLSNWQIGKVLEVFLPYPEIVDTVVSLLDQIFVILWASGVQILIFLAGLQSISPSLYESAKVDGATGWEMFWKITLPMILPLTVVNVIFTIIDTYADYNNDLLQYIVQTTMGPTQTYGSALAWIFFVTMFLFILLVMAGLQRLGRKYAA